MVLITVFGENYYLLSESSDELGKVIPVECYKSRVYNLLHKSYSENNSGFMLSVGFKTLRVFVIC